MFTQQGYIYVHLHEKVLCFIYTLSTVSATRADHCWLEAMSPDMSK